MEPKSEKTRWSCHRCQLNLVKQQHKTGKYTSLQFKQLINSVWDVKNQSTGSQLQIPPPPIGIWLRQSVTALNTLQKNTNNDCKVICYFSHQWLSPLPLQWMLDNTIDLQTKSKGPRVSGASRAWSRWSSSPQSPCPPFVGAPPTARKSPFQPTASPPQIPERIFYFWKLHFTMTGHRDKTLT